MTEEQYRGPAASDRRTFLRRASIAAAAPAVVALVGAGGTATANAAGSTDLPDFAPVPPTSFGPALNSAGYYVGQISGNLYWVTDSSYQAMFLATRDGVVLVDAPPTIGRNIQRAIDSVTKPQGLPSRVTHVVYSHNHADHIGAAGLFGRDVEVIAHTEARRLLRVANDPNRPVPSVTFDDRHVLTVGGERLELVYHGPNHSPDNIFVYAPRQRTLMVVDVIFPGWTPFKNLAESQDVPGWLAAHQTAMDYSWTTLVSGHLGRLGSRQDVVLQQNYVTDLQDSARTALTTLDPTPYFQKYGSTGNSWAIFKTYLDGVARQAADPVVAKYIDKLAAADVFTMDNAASMVNSLRIDAGVLGPFGIHP
ncbi:MBL fold metallo-hydrolase [Kutzneria kofuensis]|uniref:Glyoxylase-like metal-dependent hydrolase (Beta-lactamase superfamily II) n=1 Tax=Kutzneria kofuensis TaxID=103725 RepID=A0A7W9KQ82_9PSEU|nr:MBL fold metallo-hydrolase [Kutzneria kofuensis]MBB5896637.1 glyoxylase-like metal-dependent hydrolase (beta-lactamase superfamily II) [Kutzneria kofuensis]